MTWLRRALAWLGLVREAPPVFWLSAPPERSFARALSVEEEDALEEAALLWLRAGAPPPDAWRELTLEERLALARAGDRLDAARAARRGVAALSEAHAAAILAPADGGARARRLALETLLAEAEEATRAG